MIPAAPKPMTPTDIARGYPLGHVASRIVPDESPPVHPKAALEAVIERQLRRPPCIIAFSGGRDSSAVLAVAVHVARRDGLPEPIPVTRRFTDAPSTEETDWQELMISHLGVHDWVLERIDDEMDVIGPVSQERLRRYGVLFPALLHGDEFLLRHARGGSVLDGEGGDEVLGPEQHRFYPVAAALRGLRSRRRPSRSHLRRAAGALAPNALRGRRAARRVPSLPLPWLRPSALQELASDYRRHVGSEPLGTRRSILRVPARASVVSGIDNRRAIAREQDVEFVSPFLEPTVVHAFAHAAGPLGFPGRETALRLIAGSLLPPSVITRRSKAEFNSAIFRRHTREFALGWAGEGVDTELVDPEVLREIWLGETGNALTSSLLQSAWLAVQDG